MILPALHLLILCRLIVVFVHDFTGHIYPVGSHVARLSGIQCFGDVAAADRVRAHRGNKLGFFTNDRQKCFTPTARQLMITAVRERPQPIIG